MEILAYRFHPFMEIMWIDDQNHLEEMICANVTKNKLIDSVWRVWKYPVSHRRTRVHANRWLISFTDRPTREAERERERAIRLQRQRDERLIAIAKRIGQLSNDCTTNRISY